MVRKGNVPAMPVELPADPLLAPAAPAAPAVPWTPSEAKSLPPPLATQPEALPRTSMVKIRRLDIRISGYMPQPPVQPVASIRRQMHRDYLPFAPHPSCKADGSIPAAFKIARGS